MSRTSYLLVLLLIGSLVCGGLILESRAAQRAYEQEKKGIGVQMQFVESQRAVEAALSLVRRGQERLHAQLERLSTAGLQAGGLETLPTEGIDAPPIEEQRDGTEALESLPPLPAGVSARALVKREVSDLVGDEQLNPTKRQLTTLEETRVAVELIQARAKRDLLSSAVRLAVVEATETLRGRGDFVLYPRGESLPPIEGVLTSAELTEDGGWVRTFYLTREEFPEIYEKREERGKVAEFAARKVVALLSN